MKFVAVAIVLVTKISILFKIFHSHFQMKFFGIAALGLVMQLLKFWLDIKNGYSPPRFLHYDSASKQNHFSAEDVHWARHYEDERRQNSQNFVYRDQRPREEYNWESNSNNNNINNNYEFGQGYEPFPNYNGQK